MYHTDKALLIALFLVISQIKNVCNLILLYRLREPRSVTSNTILLHLQPAIIASKSPWEPQMQPWLQAGGGCHQSKGNFNQE